MLRLYGREFDHASKGTILVSAIYARFNIIVQYLHEGKGPSAAPLRRWTEIPADIKRGHLKIGREFSSDDVMALSTASRTRGLSLSLWTRGFARVSPEKKVSPGCTARTLLSRLNVHLCQGL